MMLGPLLVFFMNTSLLNEVIKYLLDELMVIHRKSTPYHPQDNGQGESSKKTLYTLLTKIVEASCTNWELKLHSSLWAYRVACKTSIRTTPFNMVFGLDAILPMEFLLPTLRVAQSLNWTGHKLLKRLKALEQLDETHLQVVDGMSALKHMQKSFYDAKIKTKELKPGHLVLAYTLK